MSAIEAYIVQTCCTAHFLGHWHQEIGAIEPSKNDSQQLSEPSPLQESQNVDDPNIKQIQFWIEHSHD